MRDTTVKKVSSGHSPQGDMGQKYLASGVAVSMRLLPRRYDAFLFLNETQALRPLHEVKARAEGEVPETYPSGV
jgi:hypothetical protein